MIRVLFICLGNICRSPAAEGAFAHLVKKSGLEKQINVDSAGTSDYHIGEKSDSRMRKHAAKRGIHLTHRARQFVKKDFENFDYIIAMDHNNYQDILTVSDQIEHHNKVYMMSDFKIKCHEIEVPDPYYEGPECFERVLDIVTDSSQGLLDKITKELIS